MLNLNSSTNLWTLSPWKSQLHLISVGSPCVICHTEKTLLCRTINPAWNLMSWKKRKSAWWKTKESEKTPKDSWQQGKQRCSCSVSTHWKGLPTVGRRKEKQTCWRNSSAKSIRGQVSEQNEKNQLRWARLLHNLSEVFQAVSICR